MERYVDINGLMEYVSLGRNKALELGEKSGAKIKFERRAIYNLRVIDEYIEDLRQEQAKERR